MLGSYLVRDIGGVTVGGVGGVGGVCRGGGAGGTYGAGVGRATRQVQGYVVLVGAHYAQECHLQTQ